MLSLLTSLIYTECTLLLSLHRVLINMHPTSIITFFLDSFFVKKTSKTATASTFLSLLHRASNVSLVRDDSLFLLDPPSDLLLRRLPSRFKDALSERSDEVDELVNALSRSASI